VVTGFPLMSEFPDYIIASIECGELNKFTNFLFEYDYEIK
jgi:hypothetical protein